MSLISIKNGSFFSHQPFGLNRISFEIYRGRKYHISTDSKEKAMIICRLLEGRLSPQSGFLEREKNIFVQSDRLLLEDQVIEKTLGEKLLLKEPFFYFKDKNRTKQIYLEKFQMRKSILNIPVYKLEHSKKIQFALLSLLFQESGLIILQSILEHPLNTIEAEILYEILQFTRCTLCVITIKQQQNLTCDLSHFDFLDINVSREQSNLDTSE